MIFAFVDKYVRNAMNDGEVKNARNVPMIITQKEFVT